MKSVIPKRVNSKYDQRYLILIQIELFENILMEKIQALESEFSMEQIIKLSIK